MRPVAKRFGAVDADAEVVAIKGLLLSQEPDVVAHVNQPAVHVVDFAPLADLLGTVDVVVAAGGAGTVVSTAARGKPLVLIPQGADQHMVSAAAAAAGIAIVIEDPSSATAAVRRLFEDDGHRTAADAVARQIAGMPAPASVMASLLAQVACRR